MKNLCIGIDTSCYTTSVAVADNSGNIVFDERIMLDVKSGNCGLRQSDGVFLHIKNLPILIDKLYDAISGENVYSVCVSEKPTPQDGSYMPVFLPGKLTAISIAKSLSVPIYFRTHQEGHIRAALSQNMMLKDTDFLAFHISGGTTDILHIGSDFSIDELGSASDIHLGQLFDRTGVKLSLPFPCGKYAEETAARFCGTDFTKIPTSVNGLCCSLSGAEAWSYRMIDEGKSPEEIFYSLYDFSARTLAKLIENAYAATNTADVLLAGGVSSSNILRKLLTERMKSRCRKVKLHFCDPELSRDNAVGIALLGYDEYMRSI